MPSAFLIISESCSSANAAVPKVEFKLRAKLHASSNVLTAENTDLTEANLFYPMRKLERELVVWLVFLLAD